MKRFGGASSSAFPSQMFRTKHIPVWVACGDQVLKTPVWVACGFVSLGHTIQILTVASEGREALAPYKRVFSTPGAGHRLRKRWRGMKIQIPKSKIQNRACFVLMTLALCPPAFGQTAKAAATKRTKAVKKAAPATITVTPRVRSEVAGGVFTLGEIATFSGKDSALIAKLRAVEVGTSPLPGLSRSLSPGDIVVKLRAGRLEIPQVVLTAPPSMEIVRAHVGLTGAALVKAALEAAKPLLSEMPDATLEAENPPQNLNLPTGKMTLTAGACKGRAENGAIFVPIAVAVDGRPFQTVEITLRAHRLMRVVVANRQLEPGEILTLDDVSLAKIDVISAPNRLLTTTKQTIGKRVRRRVLSDAPLAASDLETPPAVLANAEVTIQFNYGAVQVTARARTLQSGAIGETIRVQTTDTHKELDAVIVNSHTVRMVETGEGDAPTTEPAPTESETSAP